MQYDERRVTNAAIERLLSALRHEWSAQAKPTGAERLCRAIEMFREAIVIAKGGHPLGAVMVGLAARLRAFEEQDYPLWMMIQGFLYGLTATLSPQHPACQEWRRVKAEFLDDRR